MSEDEVIVGDLILVELLRGFRPGPMLRRAEVAMKARRNQAALLHNDRDFDQIEKHLGLVVRH
jgi:hypothetical protein